MDNYLSTEFGNLGLSSTAREWRPPGAQQQQRQQQQQQSRSYQQQQPPELRRQHQPQPNTVPSNSNDWQQQHQQHGETELNYSVKEFVPGHGWSTQRSSAAETVNDGKNMRETVMFAKNYYQTRVKSTVKQQPME